MTWFAEFNHQIDWYTHSVSLDLDAKNYNVIATYISDSFFRMDFYSSD